MFQFRFTLTGTPLPRMILVALVFALFTTSAFAQRKAAVTAGLGTMYYYGDLSDEFQPSQLKAAFNASYQQYFTPRVSMRAGLTIGQIAASDATTENLGRQTRNLHFKSIIVEAQTVGVVELLPDHTFGAGTSSAHITPYGFAGIGLYHFNPKAELRGEWHALQPLGTEGQTMAGGPGKYSRFQITFPVGIGINARISERAAISVEVGYRGALTDYLDDVSTDYPELNGLAETVPLAAELSERSPAGVFQANEKRGNPGKNDGYMSANFSFTYYLGQK